MECAGLLPRFGNHCESCQSLDYEPVEDKFERKKPTEVHNPFKLANIPDHLLSAVLEKMNNDSFAKFRRTNKGYSEYVDKNRSKLRIAMFHDRSLRMDMDQGTVNYIGFSYYPTPYVLKQNRLPITETVKYEKLYGNEKILKRVRYNQFGIVEDDVVRFRVDKFMSDIDLRKELVGCYKPYLVQMPAFLGSNSEKDTYHQPFINFLRWANVKKVTFYAHWLGVTTFLQICEAIEPRTLNVIGMQEPPQDLSSSSCFKETIAMHFEYKTYKSVLNCIENLQFYSARKVEQSDFFEIIQAWMKGENDVKEMSLELSGEISLDQFCPIAISKKASWQYIRHQMTYLKFLALRRMRTFILKQYDTEKKAFCMLASSKRTDRSCDSVYFKVIS